jgi:hypothetical protein
LTCRSGSVRNGPAARHQPIRWAEYSISAGLVVILIAKSVRAWQIFGGSLAPVE